MGKLVYYSDTNEEYAYLDAGERLYWVAVYAEPAYIHPVYGVEVPIEAGHVIARDEKSARKKFLARKSTKAEMPAGSKVARVSVDDRTSGICQYCQNIAGH